MSKKKKHHHEEHEEHVNHEAWVIPYADMLTLLMALFLVLWSMGQTDTNKMKQVSSGFADSLGIEGNGNGVGGRGVLEGAAAVIEANARPDIVAKIQGQAMAALEDKIESAQQATESREQLQDLQYAITREAQAAGLDGQLDFRVEARGLVVSIVSEGVLFDAGSAELRSEGSEVLDRLAGSLRAMPNRLSIEGHTDDRPISTGRYPSNWELSSARAAAVLRYFIDRHGFDATRLEVAAYGDTKPVVPNVDDAARARNRRVDIAVLAPVPMSTDSTPTTTIDVSAAVGDEMSQVLPGRADTGSGAESDAAAE